MRKYVIINTNIFHQKLLLKIIRVFSKMNFNNIYGISFFRFRKLNLKKKTKKIKFFLYFRLILERMVISIF
jgi:hypothetical protein